MMKVSPEIRHTI